jgi:hypothetical protein
MSPVIAKRCNLLGWQRKGKGLLRPLRVLEMTEWGRLFNPLYPPCQGDKFTVSSLSGVTWQDAKKSGRAHLSFCFFSKMVVHSAT